MLRRIYSSDARFKAMNFRPGLNIVIADKTAASRETDSRNGAGKSSLVEVVHFLLGMGRLTGSVLATPALKSKVFILELDWPTVDATLSVSRTVSGRSRVHLQPNVTGDTAFASLAGEVQVAEWVATIGKDLFGFPVEHAGISARNLLSQYARRVSQHGMDDPLKTFPTQSVAEASANAAYLLGLDWRLASNYQDLAGRDALRKKLKQASKDPTFRFIVGSVSELRGQVASATVRVKALEEQVAAFRVVPEHENLQKQADDIDARIRSARVQDAADRRNLRDLEAALTDVREPDVKYLQRVYQELGITLPDVLVRRYDDVRDFHLSIVSNRRAYLEEEIGSTRERLKTRQTERDELGETQAQLMKGLHEGGALAAFTSIQEQLTRARAKLEQLSARFETAKQLEATQSEIRFDRIKLQKELSRDLIEREPLITEINMLFQRFSTALYGPDRDAFLEISALETSLRIAPHIGGEHSQGISKMVIFCFDLTCAVLAHRSGRGPDFLIHDSHLFDGVDERQVAEALQLVQAVCAEERLQYILTMNSDDLEKVRHHATSVDDAVLSPRLTDAYADGGLFGFRFE